MTCCGYSGFYQPICINAYSSGAGFGALLGSSVVLLQNTANIPNRAIALACLSFPILTIVSFYIILKHNNSDASIQSPKTHQKPQKRESVIEATEINETNFGTQKHGSNSEIMIFDKNKSVEFDTNIIDMNEDDDDLDKKNKTVGMFKTMKTIFIDLAWYSFPILVVYMLYNICNSGLISPGVCIYIFFYFIFKFIYTYMHVYIYYSMM